MRTTGCQQKVRRQKLNYVDLIHCSREWNIEYPIFKQKLIITTPPPPKSIPLSFSVATVLPSQCVSHVSWSQNKSLTIYLKKKKDNSVEIKFNIVVKVINKYLLLLSFPFILFGLFFQLCYIFIKYLPADAFFSNGTIKRQ